ncbi:MAG: hypothetical protein IJ849_03755 [Selenomonadaceae bacterium]|nr:hypothetical protein [Selenomonadaceae bacterium]
MEISIALQNYLDFGIYHCDGIDYIEGKNADVVMSGDWFDKKSGEECEFDILDIRNGKFVKAIISGSDLTCRYLTQEEIRKLYSELESTNDEAEDDITVKAIDLGEIFDEMPSTTDAKRNKIDNARWEKWQRDSRYSRVGEIREYNWKTNNKVTKEQIYHDSLRKLQTAMFIDIYTSKLPIANDPSYTHLKKLIRKCWNDFISLDKEDQIYASGGYEDQIYASGGYNDARLHLISKAPIIEDEEILTVLENYKSPKGLVPLDNKLFTEAKNKMREYKEIYAKIEANKDYKRSKFIKEILQLYPDCFDNVNKEGWFVYSPIDLLQFWYMYGKINIYKRKRLYYINKPELFTSLSKTI